MVIRGSLRIMCYVLVLVFSHHSAAAGHNTYVYWSRDNNSATGYISVNKPMGTAYNVYNNIIDWKITVDGRTLHTSNSRVIGGSGIDSLKTNSKDPFGVSHPGGKSQYSVAFRGDPEVFDGDLNILLSRDNIVLVNKNCSGDPVLCYEQYGGVHIKDVSWSLRPVPVPLSR